MSRPAQAIAQQLYVQMYVKICAKATIAVQAVASQWS